MEIELTDYEKRFLALAIQGLVMRQGPPTFDFAVELSKKLGLEKELEDFLKNWIAYSQGQGEPPLEREHLVHRWRNIARPNLRPGPEKEGTE